MIAAVEIKKKNKDRKEVYYGSTLIFVNYLLLI